MPESPAGAQPQSHRDEDLQKVGRLTDSNKKILKIALPLVSILICYAILEIAFYIASGFPEPILNPARETFRLSAITRGCASFDPDMMCRRDTEPCRLFRVTNGVLVYDNVFRGNNAGCVSRYDYSYKKNPATKRIIVFGDSFTIGHYNAVPWPDRLVELLNLKNTSTIPAYEVYNFAIDGGGLMNWHHTFFHEIVPKYEFDAIIVASFADNLSRGLTMWHTSKRGLDFGRFDRTPKTHAEFENHFLPRLRPFLAFRTDEQMDSVKSDLTLPPEGWNWPDLDFYAFRFLYARLRLFIEQPRIRREMEMLTAKTTPSGSTPAVTREELEARYARIGLLWEMIEYCKKHDKRVLVSPIPTVDGAIVYNQSKGNLSDQQRELLSVAKHRNVDYFDGYGVFESVVPPEKIRDYWLREDSHWALAGSDLYAQALARYMTESDFLR